MLKNIGSCFQQFDWFFNGTLTGERLAFQKAPPFLGIVRDPPGSAGPRLLPRQWWFPFVLLLFVLLYGPTSPPAGFNITSFFFAATLNFVVTIGAIWTVGWILDRLLHRAGVTSYLFWVQFSFIACGLAFFVFALFDGHLDDKDPRWREDPYVPFPKENPNLRLPIPFAHLWLPFAFWAFFVVAWAHPLARRMLGDLASRIRAQTNLKVKLTAYLNDLLTNEKPEPKTTFFRSLFDVLSSPVEILYGPALFIVVIDSRAISQISFIGTIWGKVIYYAIAVALGLGAIWALMRAEKSNAWAAMRTNVRRIFWFGGSFLTTVFVIVLAGIWLWEVSYVTTVMEGSRLTVISLLLASYALFWTFEYWKNYAYCEELLGILGKSAGESFLTLGDFRVCVHGTAKISVIHQPADPHTDEMAPKVFDRSEFYDGLFKKFDEPEKQAPVPNPDEQVGRSAGKAFPDWSKELSGTAKMCFVILDLLFFVPIIVLGVVLFQEWEPLGLGFPARIPIVNADLTAQRDPKETKEMEDLLFKGAPAATPGKRPRVILVAASGGGTRAALYTSSVLEGLYLKNRLREVKAVSGVSGGGVALAYFAAHHRNLVDSDDDKAKETKEERWDHYHRAVGHKYFIDVLRSATEFRLPYHTSISALLPEKFERQFYENDDERKLGTLGAAPIGLIFNTTLVGESPAPFKLIGDFKPKGGQFRASKYGSGMYAGSRLILTNLKHYPDDFPVALGDSAYPWNDVLRYVVVNDPTVRVTRAASLNANFPPVFPNAPVDVKDKDGEHRYWVTDGGAEENRGQVSLLLAARGAIERRLKGKDKSTLPDIHLVIVEASAGSTEYKQDYGLSAAANSPQKLANQLAIEIERDLQRRYADLHTKHDLLDAENPKKGPVFKTHYLPLPSAFRVDGGVGTHWMLPDTAKLGQPTVTGVDTNDELYLDRETIKMLIRVLHNDAYGKKYAEKKNAKEQEAIWKAIKKVERWAEDDPLPSTHTKAWRDLLIDLDAK